MTAFERAALAYAELGWAVFPLAENTKVPAISKWCGGKGVYDATTDATVIRTWAKQYPHANVGVACGQVSGMVVIDVDPRNGGHVALAELAAKGRAFPPGPRARTVNGGQHIFLKFDPVITGGQHRLGRGIDVKASGGYVVLAPSQVIRTDGSRGTYEWLTDPHTAALPRPPLWLTTMFKPKPAPRANDQPTAGNLASIARFVSGRTEGERNKIALLGGLPGWGNEGQGHHQRACSNRRLDAGSDPRWLARAGDHEDHCQRIGEGWLIEPRIDNSNANERANSWAAIRVSSALQRNRAGRGAGQSLTPLRGG